MKKAKIGLLCLAMSALAGQAMAMSGAHEPAGDNDRGHHDTRPTASVPEPTQLALLAVGIVGLGLARRFKK